jgi:hypothetical protein
VTATQGIMTMFACCEAIMIEMKMSLCRQISILIFFKSSLGTYASRPVLLYIGGDNADDRPTVQWEVPPA